MNSVWTNPRFRAGWKTFERMLRQKMQTMQYSPSANDEYGWSRLFEDSLDQLESMKASGLTTDVFETHRSVIVRITLPKSAANCRPDISITPEEVQVKGIPGKMDENIRLPARVFTTRGKALLSKGVLEIILRKRNIVKPANEFKLKGISKKGRK